MGLFCSWLLALLGFPSGKVGWIEERYKTAHPSSLGNLWRLLVMLHPELEGHCSIHGNEYLENRTRLIVKWIATCWEIHFGTSSVTNCWRLALSVGVQVVVPMASFPSCDKFGGGLLREELPSRKSPSCISPSAHSAVFTFLLF